MHCCHWGIIYGILWVGGEVVDRTHQWQHNWKPQSRVWDNWREMMSKRDIRLTGSEDIQLVSHICVFITIVGSIYKETILKKKFLKQEKEG